MKIDEPIDSILLGTLIRLAEMGIPEAQYRLGKEYQEGYSMTRDKLKAFMWLMKAAEQKHPKALLEVAQCFARGEGTSVDMPRAIEYYEQAVQYDVMEAQWRLGDIYLEGRWVSKDVVRAKQLYEQACKSKDRVVEKSYGQEPICPEAEWSLGVMLEEGIGGDKDLDGAKKHYSRASGIKEVKDRDLSMLELRYARLRDCGSRDFLSYEKAATEGSLDGMRNYVTRSVDCDTRTRKDDYNPFSQSLFEKCLNVLIKHRDRDAILIGCDKTINPQYNEPKFTLENKNCFKVLWPLIRSFDEEACQMLARVYASGVGVEKSIFNEIRCYRLVSRCKNGYFRESNIVFKKKLVSLLSNCNADDGKGEYCLWIFLSSGNHVIAPKEFVLAWLVKAINKGCAEAIMEKHRIDYAVARRNFAPKISGLKRSDPFSGEAICSSEDGKDSKCGWRYLFDCVLKSAELGDHDAEIWAGRILSEGRFSSFSDSFPWHFDPVSVKKDVQSAVTWYEKAMKVKELSTEDLYRYVNCLVESGYENQGKITQLFAKIANEGFTDGYLPYAQRLVEGKGCDKNLKLAKDYLHKANSLDALELLAKLYKNENDDVHYLECLGCIVEQYSKVIAEYEQLNVERQNLYGRECQFWELVHSSKLKKCVREKEIVKKAGRALIRMYCVSSGQMDRMRKAWQCLLTS